MSNPMREDETSVRGRQRGVAHTLRSHGVIGSRLVAASGVGQL